MNNTTETIYKVETTEGKSVEISWEQANRIFRTIEREYHIEDVKSKLDIISSSRTIPNITQADIDDMCDEYEDCLSEDDTWSCILDDIIFSHLEEDFEEN